MTNDVKPIPDGYHTATPYLLIKDATKAIDFYKQAFNATELFRLPGPNGGIGHAEIKIGDSPIMLADEVPEMNYLGPESLGGSAVSIMLYVEDAEKVFYQALEAGATVMKPLAEQFYGDLSGTVIDPFGHIWSVATHIEDVSQEEVERRLQKLMEEGEQES